MHRVELKVSRPGSRRFWFSSVPNAPCGVESSLNLVGFSLKRLFLMHRVELKVKYFRYGTNILSFVPNAPCGVERRQILASLRLRCQGCVPNAPCGVESPKEEEGRAWHKVSFLMHRVELKVVFWTRSMSSTVGS